jgi:hypothetical protein
LRQSVKSAFLFVADTQKVYTNNPVPAPCIDNFMIYKKVIGTDSIMAELKKIRKKTYKSNKVFWNYQV